MDAAPGEFPYRRGARTTGDWRIREEIDAVNVETANREACAAVAAGAEGIAFSSVLVEGRADLDGLLANLGEIPVHFERGDEQVGAVVDREASRRTARSAGFNGMRCAGQRGVCGRDDL